MRRQWQLPRKCNIFPARVTGAMGTLCPIHAQHSCRQTCQQCMMVFVMERMHLHPCTQLVWQVSFNDIFWWNLVGKYLLKSYFLLDTFNTYSESAKCCPVNKHTQNGPCQYKIFLHTFHFHSQHEQTLLTCLTSTLILGYRGLYAVNLVLAPWYPHLIKYIIFFLLEGNMPSKQDSNRKKKPPSSNHFRI